ncbi:type II secretion system secretin GspD [Pontiella sulfatireligans]|uniref:Type II secretion system protein D n=1 Tax=Pontiella sulfatireligans TaxID=2750658 RepID=A0A6C2USE0_9BACT|nr:type II secretion system secretin GspD [Pontiella sulfatireligans]VGO22174.1 Type II secretion system protein D [Pontiella sulfatireligans]
MHKPSKILSWVLTASMSLTGLPGAFGQEARPPAPSPANAAPQGTAITSQRDSSTSIPPVQSAVTRDASKSEVAINWENVTLKDCIEVLSRDLGMEFIISPSVNVTQEVSIRAGDVTTWNRENKLELFDAILDTAGVQRIQRGRVWIYSPSDIRPVVLGSANSDLPDGQPVIGVIKLQNISGAQAQQFLSSVGGKPQRVFAMGGSQTIIVIGTKAFLRQVEELVAMVDLPPSVMSHYVLEMADSEDVAGELTNIFYRQEGSNGQPIRFFAVPRLNAVVAQNLALNQLAQVEKWVKLLDKTDDLNERVTKVYRMQVIEAEEIGKTLSSLYSDLYKQAQLRERERGKTATKIAKASVAAPAPAAASKTAGASKAKTASPKAKSSASHSANGGASLGGSAVQMDEEVIILSDKDTNTLIVNAPADMQREIERTIKELDKSRRQVLIETAMVEVVLDEGIDLGVEWAVQGGGQDRSSAGQQSGLELGDLASGITPITDAANGFTYFLNANDKKWALIQAAQDDNRLQVLSSPTVLTRDGMEAEVSFGQEVPIRQSTLSSGGNENFSFDYRDAKITLRVTPHIDDQEMVTLNIEQEIRRVVEDSIATEDSAPTFRTREIRSNLQVDNGQTIILGGLIERGDIEARVGIPYLMDIPFVGYLFGRTVIRKEGTEILMVLTPHVVDSRDETDLLTRDFRRKLMGALSQSSEEIRKTYNLQEEEPVEPVLPEAE